MVNFPSSCYLLPTNWAIGDTIICDALAAHAHVHTRLHHNSSLLIHADNTQTPFAQIDCPRRCFLAAHTVTTHIKAQAVGLIQTGVKMAGRCQNIRHSGVICKEVTPYKTRITHEHYRHKLWQDCQAQSKAGATVRAMTLLQQKQRKVECRVL